MIIYHVAYLHTGDKNCDLITDTFHAVGFEAEFVIVFGSRSSLCAASRATTKLAIIDIKSYLQKSQKFDGHLEKIAGAKSKQGYQSFRCRVGHKISNKNQPGSSMGEKCHCGEPITAEYKRSTIRVIKPGEPDPW